MQIAGCVWDRKSGICRVSFYDLKLWNCIHLFCSICAYPKCSCIQILCYIAQVFIAKMVLLNDSNKPNSTERQPLSTLYWCGQELGQFSRKRHISPCYSHCVSQVQSCWPDSENRGGKQHESKYCLKYKIIWSILLTCLTAI